MRTEEILIQVCIVLARATDIGIYYMVLAFLFFHENAVNRHFMQRR
jgi:hypothetical protein